MVCLNSYGYDRCGGSNRSYTWSLVQVRLVTSVVYLLLSFSSFQYCLACTTFLSLIVIKVHTIIFILYQLGIQALLPKQKLRDKRSANYKDTSITVMASQGSSCYNPNKACCYNVTTYPIGVYNYVSFSFKGNAAYLNMEDRQGYNSSSQYEEAPKGITEMMESGSVLWCQFQDTAKTLQEISV